MHVKVPGQIKGCIKNEIKKYTEVLKPLKRKPGEADTANLIFDILGDIFNYDRAANAAAEYRIRGKFADFVIRLDGDLKDGHRGQGIQHKIKRKSFGAGFWLCS